MGTFDGARDPASGMLGVSSTRKTRKMTSPDDQELLAVVERRFAIVEQRFADLAERIDDSRTENLQRFDRLEGEVRQNGQRLDRVEGEVRHAHVRIESLDGAVRLVAEGVASVDDKLDRFRIEVGHEFEGVRAEIRLSYGKLDQRITAVEGR